jgi:hypothetical protein
LEKLVALMVHLKGRDGQDDRFAVALPDTDSGVMIW